MVEFGDPTAWLQLLSQREAVQLRRQEMELSRQQQQFDNAMRQEDRDLRIAESVERRALLELQTNYEQFKLEFAQKTMDFDVRKSEAQAQGAEEDVQSERTMRPLREQEAKLRIQNQKNQIAEWEQDQQYLSMLAPMQQGVTTAIGENPTIETLARVASSMGKVAGFAEKHLPARIRSKLKEGGLKAALGIPIGVILEGRAKLGDPDASAAILGASQFSEFLQEYVSDEARTAARQTGNRMLQGIGAQINALPSDKAIAEDFHTFGDADIAIQHIDGIQESAKASAAQLGLPIFSLDEFSGTRNSLAFAYDEKKQGWDRLRKDLGAGAFVYNMGAGVFNESQRRGVNIIAKGLVNDTLASTNPAMAVERLGSFVERTQIYPREQMAVLFDAASRSTDPLAVLRASMVYDKVYGMLDEHKRADLTADVMAIPGLYERMSTIGVARKTRVQEEMAAFSSGDRGQIDKYATGITFLSDKSMEASRAIAEEAQVLATGTDAKKSETMADVSGNSREAAMNRAHYSLVRAEQLLGNQGWGGDGLRDYYNTNNLPADLKQDFANAMIQVKADHEDLPDSDLARIAGDIVKKRWIKEPWLGDGSQPDQYHPVLLAASAGSPNMDTSLAARVSRYQLQTEYLDNVVTTKGEPARVRIDDVMRKPALDPGGGPFSYFITDRGGNVLALPQRKDLRWAPGLTKEALIATALRMEADGTAAGTNQRSGVFPYGTKTYKDIIAYLGEEWPAAKSRRQQIVEENVTGRDERRAWFGGERARLLEATPGSKQRTPPPGKE